VALESDFQTAVSNCCSAICVLLLLFLLFSLIPCFLSLVIAQILRGASNQSVGFYCPRPVLSVNAVDTVNGEQLTTENPTQSWEMSSSSLTILSNPHGRVSAHL
jgi:hypothetical protein